MRSAEEYPRLTALLDSLGDYSPDVGMCLPELAQTVERWCENLSEMFVE